MLSAKQPEILEAVVKWTRIDQTFWLSVSPDREMQQEGFLEKDVDGANW